MQSVLVVLLIIFLLPYSDALFGFGKKKKEKREKAKNDVSAGISMLSNTVKDKDALKDALAALDDPEMMQEVEKMMQDPDFKKEIEAYTNSPEFQAAMEQTKAEIERVQRIKQANTGSSRGDIAARGTVRGGSANADLGMAELQRMASDPEAMADTMKMLQDPEVQAEVQKLMQDPEFRAQMEAYTQTPEFEHAMATAKEQLEVLSQDPAKLAEMQAEMGGIMA